MIGIAVHGAEQTIARLKGAERGIPDARDRGVRAASIRLHQELKAALSGTGGSGGFWGKTGAPGATLGVRSGHTRDRLSPGGRVLRVGDVAISAVGSPDKHVRFAEEGGTIAGHPYLRIPTGAAQTAGGTDINLGRSVRGLPGYRLIRTAAGKLWIVRDRGGSRSARIEFMYLLVRSTQQRGRRLFATVREKIEPIAAALVGRQVSLEVEKANRG